MKHNAFKINHVTRRAIVAILAIGLTSFMSSCGDDDPKKENVPELITEATLTFTPVGGGAAIVATATDPDGEGVQDLTVDGPIELTINTSYTLTIELINGLADPSEEEYDITAEVEEEGDEHMFFFAWTNNVFSNPTGNGNVDNRSDAVNYNDEDENGLPLGLSTNWTSAASAADGTFRLILKHQPDLKSDVSTSSTGETDLDLTFTISID
jgi:hypothetical protein